LEVQNFQPQPLPGVIRSLSFDNNGVKTHVSPYDTTYDKALFKADLILQEIIREASLFPKSNIKTSIQIKRLNNRIIPTLLLENNGTIPIKLSINDMENKQLININMEILKKSASGFNFEKIKSIKFSPKEIQLFIKKNGFIKNQIILDKNNKILIPLPEQDALTLTDDMFFRCNLHLWLITDNYKPIHIQTDYPISEKTEKDLLKLTVKLNHVSYQRETPISLTLCLTNISDRPLLVPNRFLLNYNHSPKPYRDIYFIFEGPTGYKSNIVFLLNAGEIKKENLMILLPGKKIENVINLTKYFSLHLPGKYIITAHYTNFTNISGTNVWCGEVISDKFIITRR
jgi:hypothetical protein